MTKYDEKKPAYVVRLSLALALFAMLGTGFSAEKNSQHFN